MTAATPGRLRILHVSEVHWGGVVTLLEHFVQQQVRAGHDVVVLAHPGMPPLDPGARVAHWEVDRRRPWTLPGAHRQLRRLVREIRPDVVHLHSFFAGALGRFTSSLADTPVVYQPHAWSDGVSGRRLVRALVRTVERRLAGSTDLLVTNCEDELARGREIGVVLPGHAIGVAVDLGRFRPPDGEERARARAQLGLDARQRIALVLGRLTRQKGQDLLLPAWCADPPADSRLLLVGPGDPALVAEHAGDELGRSVLAPGGTEDVVPWLWAADVMVLPSRYETVALVVAEAMSTGLPVVATAVDGAEEVLCGGPEDPAGVVVPLGDAAGLVRETTQRLDHPGLRHREGAAGPCRARERFAPEVVTQRLEAAYRDAIRRHGGERCVPLTPTSS